MPTNSLPDSLPDFRAQPAAFLQALFAVAVRQAQPSHVLPAYLSADSIRPAQGGRLLVLGAGKAAAAMAWTVEECCHSWFKPWLNPAGDVLPAQLGTVGLTAAQAEIGQPLFSGLVVTPYGHIPPRPASLADVPQHITVLQAAHPVPDAASQDAAERMLALARSAGPHDVVLFLVSGGGSSLLAMPAHGLSLQEKQRIHQALVHSGASISDINCVRKHLSAIKGGRLAQACGQARVVTLAISDVPGDDPAVIASGPTVPDTTTAAQALSICNRYRIDLPEAALHALGCSNVPAKLPRDVLDAPSNLAANPPNDVQGLRTLHLVATPWQSLQAAAQAARAVGLPTHILSDAIEGDAVQAAQMHAALAQCVAQHGQPFVRPCLLLSGGETTVAMPDHGSLPATRGQGGRATTFALALAQSLNAQPGIWALAADTDGVDGSGPHAGALVTPSTLERGKIAGLLASKSIEQCASANFFAACGDLITTGPTLTNVNDFRAVLVL